MGVETLLTVTEKSCVITSDPSDTETGWATEVTSKTAQSQSVYV